MLDRSLRGRRVRAIVARVGVLEYPELGVDELVTADALRRTDSLVGRPVVVGHPEPDANGSRFLRADSVIVGHVVSARFDESTGEVHAELEITEALVLGAVAAGGLAEVSPGYASSTEARSGSWQGRRYDTVQIDREYDHVALLPPGHARCGSACSCRTDAARAANERTDAMSTSTQTEEMLRRWESRLDERQKRIDEEEKKLEEEKKDAEVKAAEGAEKTDADKVALEAERDALKAKLAETEAKLAAMGSEEALDARADARASLVATYRRVHGADAPLERTDDKGAKKRLSNREIKIAVLTKLGRTVDMSRSDADAYIDARFDSEVELLGKAPSSALTRDLASLYAPPAHHADSGAPPVATSPHTAGRTPPPTIESRYLRG